MSHLPVAGFCRGDRVKLAETCQLGNSTPRFLAAQRSAVSSLREEVAQRNPLEGVPLDSSRNKRDRGPSGTPGLPGTEIFPVGRCYVLLSAQSSGVRQIWKTRLGAKQISSGNFSSLGKDSQGKPWGFPCASSFFCKAFSFLDDQERKCVRTVWQASARKTLAPGPRPGTQPPYTLQVQPKGSGLVPHWMPVSSS